jgi:hypothetical protein
MLNRQQTPHRAAHRCREATLRLTFPHNDHYLAKRRFRSVFGSESTNESDLVNSNLEYAKVGLYDHHANWALLDRRVQAVDICSLHLRTISSTAEHMSRVERAPSTETVPQSVSSP